MSAATWRATWRTSSTALLFAGGLADNGGPTQTIALLDGPTNPALAGALAMPARHRPARRGPPGPAGTDPDVGAFELGAVAAAATRSSAPSAASLPGHHERGRDPRPRRQRHSAGPRRRRPAVRRQRQRLLFGNAGLDQLTGGLGADRFVLARDRARPHPTARPTRRSWTSTAAGRQDRPAHHRRQRGRPRQPAVPLRRRRRRSPARRSCMSRRSTATSWSAAMSTPTRRPISPSSSAPTSPACGPPTFCSERAGLSCRCRPWLASDFTAARNGRQNSKIPLHCDWAHISGGRPPLGFGSSSGAGCSKGSKPTYSRA